MTLGSVARVAMEYRQHMQMINNISKLSQNLTTAQALEAAAAAAAAQSLSPAQQKAKSITDHLTTMDKLNLEKLFANGPTSAAPTPASAAAAAAAALGVTSKFGAGQNIPGFPTGNTVFDIASLMLFGTHALPIRLKILLDRLLCTLEHDELVSLLHSFGWSYEDYSRGYMLQDNIGNILTKWIIVSADEENYITQLFLKFPETKTIAQNFVLTDSIFAQYPGGANAAAAAAAAAALAPTMPGSAAAAAAAASIGQHRSTPTPTSQSSGVTMKKDYDAEIAENPLLSKNSLLNLSNSMKSPLAASTAADIHTAHNNNNLTHAHPHHLHHSHHHHHHQAKQHSIEGARSEINGSSGKQTPKSSHPSNDLASINHLVTNIALSSRTEKKSSSNSHSSAQSNKTPSPSPFSGLNLNKSQLESLMPGLADFTKKQDFVNNPLFNPFAGNNPGALGNPFSPLLNPLLDASKYPAAAAAAAAADLCKLDLSNPAALAMALGKNLEQFNQNFLKSQSAPGSNGQMSDSMAMALGLTDSVMNLSAASQQPPCKASSQNGSSSSIGSSGSSRNSVDVAADSEKQQKKQMKMKKSMSGSSSSTPSHKASRRWDPMVLNAMQNNPSTGKKRVQCNVCLKTFCDKGALKIHFSAVHLREMHKCTVDGCNMMFSSRRSRNRHSANPNPKLHTPNFRRKINPHDGRTANPYPVLPPQGPLFGLTGLNGGIITNLEALQGAMMDDDDEDIDDEEKGYPMMDFGSLSSHSGSGVDEDDDVEEEGVVFSEDDDDDELMSPTANDAGIDLSASSGAKRKRKSQNPIKLAAEEEAAKAHHQQLMAAAAAAAGVAQAAYASTDDDDDDEDDGPSDDDEIVNGDSDADSVVSSAGSASPSKRMRLDGGANTGANATTTESEKNRTVESALQAVN